MLSQASAVPALHKRGSRSRLVFNNEHLLVQNVSLAAATASNSMSPSRRSSFRRSGIFSDEIHKIGLDGRHDVIDLDKSSDHYHKSAVSSRRGSHSSTNLDESLPIRTERSTVAVDAVTDKNPPNITIVSAGSNMTKPIHQHPMIAKLATKIPITITSSPVHRSGSPLGKSATNIIGSQRHFSNPSLSMLSHSTSSPINPERGQQATEKAESKDRGEKGFMLGPKSFWLENKGMALREKAYAKIRKEAKLEADRIEREMEVREYLGTEGESDVNDSFNLEDLEEEELLLYDEAGNSLSEQPVQVRKEAFLEMVEKRAEKKRGRNVYRRRRSKY